MTATELALIRHGEAWCNVDDIVGGPRGCRGLTEQGAQQARALADRFATEAEIVDVLYSSPRLRARQTAELVADMLGLPVRVDDGLRDQDFGDADGEPRSTLYCGFPGNPILEPGRAPAPGAEPWSAYVARVRRTLHRLSRIHSGQRLMLVCHGETVNAAHHVFLGLPDGWPGPLPLTVANTAITRWRQLPWDIHRLNLGERWNLQAHNDTEHLNNL